ncbi:Uncharacterised protein [Vibrio cholerae]|nr:Uncharacterised protein [Vibrio cholerae]CSB97808.1 Uncharacterised protein [Vibrio cholerae]CSC23904.1 Uncharacterised protein [Vibrio cholerae]CSC29268.1 Uncharacterised protein [Vibrio cholerae]CSC37515.1 Uncharacterised protein [Vibrio cholerae]
MQCAAKLTIEMRKVIRLQQRVTELGKRDALIRTRQTLLYRFTIDHGIDGKVLAHIAEKIDQIDLTDPIGIIDSHQRCAVLALRGHQLRDLLA